MRQETTVSFASFLCTLFLLTAGAAAQVPAMTFSIGYSNLQTQRADNLFYTHNGTYLDADFAWRLPLIIPVQVGFGATGSGYWDRESIYNSNNDGFYPYDHLYSDVGLFELEPRVGLRLGGPVGFFALPRLGAGLLVNSYDIDQSFTNSNGTYFNTEHHTGAAFEIRPAIQAGFGWGFGSAGIDASYMWSWGDFGGLGHHANEFRVGAFFTINF